MSERQSPIEKNPSEDLFNKQYSDRESFDYLGGKIEAVDIFPEKLKDQVPVLFAPGWGETLETFKGSLKEFVKHERRVISLTHPRFGFDPINTGDLPAQELRKALTLLELLEKKKIEKVDAVAHSEGAINVVIAASVTPQKFRNLILVSPGGLVGKNNFIKHLGRFQVNTIRSIVRAIRNPEERKNLTVSGQETVKYFLQNPIRAMKEAKEISDSELNEAIKTLHSKGIGIVIVHGVDDPVFPMDMIQNNVKADSIDGFYSVKGDHNELYVNPVPYIHLIDNALSRLTENSKAKNS